MMAQALTPSLERAEGSLRLHRETFVLKGEKEKK